MKLIYCIATLVVALIFSNNISAQTASTDSVKTAVIKVANLHCNGDMPTIKKRLLNQDGIDEVAFTDREGERSTFTVTYHSSATTEGAIEKAIETTPGCDDQGETPYRVIKERKRKKGGS
jgi:copper chaperone CopZ